MFNETPRVAAVQRSRQDGGRSDPGALAKGTNHPPNLKFGEKICKVVDEIVVVWIWFRYNMIYTSDMFTPSNMNKMLLSGKDLLSKDDVPNRSRNSMEALEYLPLKCMKP